jgi:hypothetical protein
LWVSFNIILRKRHRQTALKITIFFYYNKNKISGKREPEHFLNIFHIKLTLIQNFQLLVSVARRV